MPTWIVRSQFVQAEVQSLGAMLGPAGFRIGERTVQPFAIAPWSDDSGREYEQLPGILKRLRGEWPCVPYGIAREPLSLPQAWRSDTAASPEGFHAPHGPSSNLHWSVCGQSVDSITLFLDYPESHPVKQVRRRITASADAPRLEMTLQIEIREPCELPIGLHPIFRLPERPRSALLDLGPDVQSWTSPIPLEADLSQFRSSATQVPLNAIPLAQGTENVLHLPLPYAAEEIVLTTGCAGQSILSNHEERYAICLSWDPEVFPMCQLWLSNRGRQYYPWNGRFLAVAIEPIRSAFDFGTRASRNRNNPLWRAGVPCTYSFVPGEPFETRYAIAVSPLEIPGRP